MTNLVGTIRGLRACASARGTFTVLALDQRQNLRRQMRPDAPGAVPFEAMVAFKKAVIRSLAPVSQAFLLDPEIGAAQSIADGSLPGRTGLLIAIEATGYLGEPTARVSRILHGWSVAKAKRMGASAAKLLLYYHPEARNAHDQEQLLASVVQASREQDLPLFVEPISLLPQSGCTADR
jgi:tagatose 1,6-diphosphate aldolase